MDVTIVPGIVESSLGMFLYDFFFEREIYTKDDERNIEVGIILELMTHTRKLQKV